MHRREVTSDSGVIAWEYGDRYQYASKSDWLSESKVTDSFTPHQLDVCHLLMNLYAPRRAGSRHKGVRNHRAPLSRRKVVGVCSIGTRIVSLSEAGNCGSSLRLLPLPLVISLQKQRLGGAIWMRDETVREKKKQDRSAA